VVEVQKLERDRETKRNHNEQKQTNRDQAIGDGHN
jgi:hypothetical protein